MALKDKLRREKPWVALNISRREYAATRPWARSGLSRTEFEDIIRALPHDVIKDLKDYAAAEALAAAIFGESAKD